MEILGKQRGSIGRNITNPIPNVKEGILGFEDMIEKIDISVKESVKSKEFLTQNQW